MRNTPKDILKRGESIDEFMELMKKCEVTDKQVEIVTQRYGLDGGEGRTCEEIAEGRVPPISKQAVSKLEKKALKRVGRD